ncbi:MAG: CoA pyrophosphatase [Pseudomonadales bacterium]|nr:CoA pyrophosphatase [Pseudomonadales bacterium]
MIAIDDDSYLLDTASKAAVMVLIDKSTSSLLFIHKADFLRRHAGEIAFPGGKLEVGEDLLSCAQRECLEEVGIDESQYRLLGRLPRRVTRHKVAVYPFVAVLESCDVLIQIDKSELQDAFFVPLADLMNEDNHRQRVAEIDGQMMTLDYFYHRRCVAGIDTDYKIWGVTAHVIRDFLALDVRAYL